MFTEAFCYFFSNLKPFFSRISLVINIRVAKFGTIRPQKSAKPTKECSFFLFDGGFARQIFSTYLKSGAISIETG